MGYIYLILETDKDGNNERHKIGITKNNPEKRVKQLSTGNSNVIRLLQAYESINYKRVEQWLHSRYSTLKTEANNEWFHLTDEQVIGFLETCKKLDETIQLLLKDNYFYK